MEFRHSHHTSLTPPLSLMFVQSMMVMMMIFGATHPSQEGTEPCSRRRVEPCSNYYVNSIADKSFPSPSSRHDWANQRLIERCPITIYFTTSQMQEALKIRSGRVNTPLDVRVDRHCGMRSRARFAERKKGLALCGQQTKNWGPASKHCGPRVQCSHTLFWLETRQGSTN